MPTLILLALLLDANIQDNIETSVETRSSFIVLIFGFAFLVLSSLVCGCIVHKMGLCRWNRQAYDDDVIAANHTENMDCIHVIDLPPTYEAATRQLDAYPKLSSFTKPPPSYEIACSTEKISQNISMGAVNHIWYTYIHFTFNYQLCANREFFFIVKHKIIIYEFKKNCYRLICIDVYFNESKLS